MRPLSRENRIILFTALSAFMLMLFNVASLANDADSLLDQDFNLAIDLNAKQSVLRIPASIPLLGMKEEVKKSIKKMQIYNFNYSFCDQKINNENKSVRISADYLQIRGKNCESNEFEITNTSNGYTASIFNLQKDQYKTDLIQLKPGLNLITMKIREKNDQWVEQKIMLQNDLGLTQE